MPCVLGQGRWPRVPGCNGAETAERSYPASEVRGCNGRSYHVSEVRGSGQEELPHAPKPEASGSGREEQPHAQGQGPGPRGTTPRPKSGGCVGADRKSVV